MHNYGDFYHSVARGKAAGLHPFPIESLVDRRTVQSNELLRGLEARNITSALASALPLIDPAQNLARVNDLIRECEQWMIKPCKVKFVESEQHFKMEIGYSETMFEVIGKLGRIPVFQEFSDLWYANNVRTMDYHTDANATYDTWFKEFPCARHVYAQRAGGFFEGNEEKDVLLDPVTDDEWREANQVVAEGAHWRLVKFFCGVLREWAVVLELAQKHPVFLSPEYDMFGKGDFAVAVHDREQVVAGAVYLVSHDSLRAAERKAPQIPDEFLRAMLTIDVRVKENSHARRNNHPFMPSRNELDYINEVITTGDHALLDRMKRYPYYRQNSRFDYQLRMDDDFDGVKSWR